MKYKDVYAEGCKHLLDKQIENAKLDARLLLEFICHTNRNDLLAHGEREVSAEDHRKYQQVIGKREQHIPMQYITGSQEFMGLQFKVNENVLIPRQDTEILVEEAMLHLHDGMHILDMCTGSGCILLSLLHYSNDCIGTGVDISAEALAIAVENAENLEIAADFVQSDLFQQLKTNEKYDMLVSNPPYIQTKVVENLMPEVREHEPMIALDGKEDGLFFYERIIAECGAYLNRGASVLFEIGYDQGQQVKELMEQQGYRGVAVMKDFAGLDRVVTGTFVKG